MKGAIAAGHPLTAEAGARALAEGGNAVDACIAAGFASWVTESPLTGPGAGGFMLIHRARDRTTRVLDFFVTVPGLGLKSRQVREMESVGVDFTPESSQVFRVGAASCAVPGTPAGLEAAHRTFGSLPWRALLEPAIELARGGVELTPAQAFLHEILDGILRHTPESRAVYERRGERLSAGDRLVMADLAATLELIAERGSSELYAGELGRALVQHMRQSGGAITLDDLRSYRVIRRRPVSVEFRGHGFLSNPPPSTGGILIGYALHLLDRVGTNGAAGSAEAMARLADVMREVNRARARRFMSDLYRGGLAGRLFAEKAVADGVARLRSGELAAAETGGPSGTTHISVVDARGNAAALTASTGSGSGVVVPRTGIHLNNMLGEFDLSPVGRGLRSGVRFTSMMAPSVALWPDGRPRLVIGSAGSLRLRGAILQIVLNVLEHELPVAEAIERPRVHLEDSQLHCEGGADADELDRLEAMGYDLVRWRRRNLYFGGAAGVELRHDGTLAAAGDPRRGGHGIVVE